ncbi:carbamoyl phosphate synthase small subunit [Peribacillus saganii]|uniref:Carbamoyl phosphate synthase small chain n=1 Tax=Peribacillus saganii TaxID=2303992 RepID=A0A372LLV9_9BACI|nr:carbamoyl phosphate synthase small subunit [Peribacillus saganii]RFU68043.1 carbamoyl phosphate synthase small subunit [Peribacillus saganii]
MKGYIHLVNGNSFEGEYITNHIEKDISGEVVFFTGMTGYQEVLTDPSYKGQIVVFTYPLIGNYGINPVDFESKKPHVAGVIVYEGNMHYSHFQAQSSLKEYLDSWGIPMLGGVDTRALVKQIRKEGSMASVLSLSEKPDPSLLDSQELNETVPKVSSKEAVTYGKGKYHIVLMDFGYKKSILDSLLKKDCKVTVVPYDTSFEKVKSLSPDGVMLSNGPGDPKQLNHLIGNITAILSTFPTMAICLGHQLTALAFGGNTRKMLFGHRGANQPVVDVQTKRVFMSSQNHSYEIEEESLKGTPLSVRFRNVNDGSVEGLAHKSLPILTAQYHPEANPGPAESMNLFEEFLQTVKDTSWRDKVYA